MNYLSHFYFFEKKDNPYHNCGLVFPDWLAAYKRTKLNSTIITENSNDENLYKGILDHFFGDKVFHGSDYFREQTHGIKVLLGNSKLDKDKFRFSFLAHILLEMMVDRVILLKYPDLGTRFYDNLDACNDDLLSNFAQKNSKADQAFITMVQKFKHYRFILNYIQTDHFVYSLKRIIERVGITFDEEETLEITHQIEPIENYVNENISKLYSLFNGYEK